MTRLRVLRGGRDRAVTDPVLDGALRALRRGDAEENTEGSTVLREERIRAIEAARRLALRHKKTKSLLMFAAGAAALGLVGYLVAQVYLGVAPAPTAAVLSGNPKGVLYRAAGAAAFRARTTTFAIHAGDALRTAPSGTARLALVGGAEVTLAGDSEVGFPPLVVQGTRRLRLIRGSVAVVAPLRKDERFVVDAGDHQVTVLGTEFSVTLQKVGVAPCVAVRRGAVAVRSTAGTTRLSAGQDLGCELRAAQ